MTIMEFWFITSTVQIGSFEVRRGGGIENLLTNAGYKEKKERNKMTVFPD